MIEESHGDMTGMKPLVAKPCSLWHEDLKLLSDRSLAVGEIAGAAAIAECKKCKQLSHRQKKIPVEAGQKLQIDLLEIPVFSKICSSVFYFHHVDGSRCPCSYGRAARSARHYSDVSIFASFDCTSF